MINSIFARLPEGIIKAYARIAYYRYFLRVNWKPGYSFSNKVYVVSINGIQMRFKQCPFYDIEYALLDYISNLSIKGSRTYIDAGSYIGTFAIFIAKLSNKNFIIAIEPDPVNYKMLCENISLNNVLNIKALNMGLWNTKTKLKFDSNQEERSSVNFEQHKSMSAPVIINTITLNELRKEYNKKVDYIKMDIEGAEIEAMEGATNLLKQDKPRLIIASYHLRNGQETKMWLEKFLPKYYKNVISIPSKQLVTIAYEK